MLIQERTTLEQKKQYVIGKIAQREIKMPSGTALLVPGQLITSAHASVAEKLGLLSHLYSSADSWSLDHVSVSKRQKASDIVSFVLDSGDSQSSFEPRGGVWEQIVRRAASVCNCSPEAWEEQQIKNALGYPVVRTILDDQGYPILRTGDLVTYFAVKQAKKADVLDALLNAVYWG
ncbi:MAG: hypothetical protein ACFBSC_01990 [Microcoleaceae cyanobacterium]